MIRNRQVPSYLTVSSFTLHQNGLTPVGTPTFDEWLACGHFIRNTEQSVQFWIGDWLLYGEKTYGKTDYDRAIQDTGLSVQTLYIYKYVATSIPLSLRRKNLGFHHHKEVANLAPATQVQLLHQAETEGWPLFKLRQEKKRLHLETARSSPVAASPGFHLGDCATLLAALPDASVDLVLTAPTIGTIDTARMDQILALLEKKLKINSHVYLFCTWLTYPALFLLLQKYFTVKNLLVWETKPEVLEELTRYAFTYECILFAHKGRRHLTGRRDSSMLTCADAVSITSSEKPLSLLEYLIEKSSLPGEVVCDPFAGAAATLVAAKKKGRQYIGIEENEALYQEGLIQLST